MAYKNLVIVESPAKAKTIEKFLGKEYVVKSSFGHIRDLSKKNLGIELENDYQPQYEVSPEKKKVVTELKKLTKEAELVWLASDEDREGEAIAWHLAETLNLNQNNTRRIVFHEITKEAILEAVNNPRAIDVNLVKAQQARRILDRLVGFELSPLLWKKVKPQLSAGRVQSVSVRLLVERERDINNFKYDSSYRITALFEFTDKDGNDQQLKSELNKRFKTKEEVIEFLNQCKDASFNVADVTTRPTKKSPAPPFTTSTLQQEAGRKLGFSVSQTMTIAQKLYENGLITYMRTDSVNLSKLAIGTAKSEITKEFGEAYSKTRNFTTKSKGAQEAHEAIRPTYIANKDIDASRQEQRLYELIWKRTIASQMSDAQLEKTTISVDISGRKEKFVSNGEVLKFDGFLKVYIESSDDEAEGQNGNGLLPQVYVDEQLNRKLIEATEKFTQRPARYTEASLVKKLEELGIGRPSTYAPTISTVQNRGYVIKEDRPGAERKFNYLVLSNGAVEDVIKTETFGAEKSKLFPTDIGIVVNDFLMQHFVEIMDFNFTASVEKDFDIIAEGGLEWSKMIDKFYKPFHKQVIHTEENSSSEKGRRVLGDDPKSGKIVLVRIGRYGPMAQIGEVEDEEKPKFAPLRKDQSIETISLEDALQLFALPRDLGNYEEELVIVANGRFGPYIRHKGSFYSLKKDIDDPFDIELDRAIVLIEEKREADRKKVIKTFDDEPELSVLNGRWGPYIAYQKKNYKIPKKTEPASLTKEECFKLIESAPKTKAKGRKK